MSAVRFSAEEAALSLWRRRRSTALALVTIVVALLVVGGFLLVNANVQRWVDRWSSAAELSVYLADGITPAERSAVERLLADSASVHGTEFVDHAEALRRFRTLFPDLADAASALGERPLPASFEVRLRSEAAGDARIDDLLKRLRATPGVADVRYDRRWIERLASLVRSGRIAGALLSGVLILAAALTVASVVRLALHARQQEIEIMHLVGAPLSFIRGPFVAEGVLQGGVGAVVALGLLYAMYLVTRERLGVLAAGLAGPDPALTFLPWTAVAGLIAGGMAVGCAGGLVAALSVREQGPAR
jgi:cell division transport system permease protein